MIGLKATATSTTGSSVFISFDKPSAVAVGDLLVVGVAINGGTGTTIKVPDGWTEIRREDSTTSVGCIVYYRIACDEPDRYIWEASAASTHSGVLLVFTGHDGFVPIDASGATNACIAAPPPGNVSYARMSGTDPLGVKCYFYALTGSQDLVATKAARIAQAATTMIATQAPVATAGVIAAGTTTFSSGAPGTGATIGIILRPSSARYSLEEVRQLLISLLPPGAERLYDLATTGDVGALFYAFAGLIKAQGYDLCDLIRREWVPSMSSLDLADWEALQGTSQTIASAARRFSYWDRLLGTTARWRENGGTTVNQVKQIIGAMLGHAAPLSTCTVIECPRGTIGNFSTGLTSYHTQDTGIISQSIAAGGGSYAWTFTVGDGGQVSAAGIQLAIGLTRTDGDEPVRVVVAGPPGSLGAASESWAASEFGGQAGASTVYRYLFGPGAAGKTVHGSWTVTIYNDDAVNAIAITRVGLFVEGARLDSRGFNGRGGYINEWAVLSSLTYDGAAAKADYQGALLAIKRIQPAGTRGYLCRPASSGASLYAICDDGLCIVDATICGT